MNHFKEKAMKCVFLIAACTSVLAVFLICAFLFANGIPAIAKNWSDEVPAGNEVEAVKNDWNPSNDRSKYLCNCRCHSFGSSHRLFLLPVLWQSIVRKNLSDH